MKRQINSSKWSTGDQTSIVYDRLPAQHRSSQSPFGRLFLRMFISAASHIQLTYLWMYMYMNLITPPPHCSIDFTFEPGADRIAPLLEIQIAGFFPVYQSTPLAIWLIVWLCERRRMMNACRLFYMENVKFGLLKEGELSTWKWGWRNQSDADGGRWVQRSAYITPGIDFGCVCVCCLISCVCLGSALCPRSLPWHINDVKCMYDLEGSKSLALKDYCFVV